VKNHAILILSCPDREGIVATLTQFLYQNGGNIVDANQHTDTENRHFFIRVEWELDKFKLDREQTQKEFSKIAKNFQMKWQIFYRDAPLNIALFVSKQTHCLHDILSRYDEGDLPCNIPVIIGNHQEAGPVAEKFEIAFEYFPEPKQPESEDRIFKVLEAHKIDVLVLARFMQILGSRYLEQFKDQIINIHHSFLPGFKGADPHKKAHDRGVKLIGATAHYVTCDLDEGPIIEQVVERVDHTDNVEDMTAVGRDAEAITLARAVKYHIEHRVFLNGQRTVVFK